jgi:hypothetical protein
MMTVCVLGGGLCCGGFKRPFAGLDRDGEAGLGDGVLGPGVSEFCAGDDVLGPSGVRLGPPAELAGPT